MARAIGIDLGTTYSVSNLIIHFILLTKLLFSSALVFFKMVKLKLLPMNKAIEQHHRMLHLPIVNV
jgi:hypothetical protein